MPKKNSKRIDFEFRIKLAGDGTEHISSEVVLGDVPWTIKVRESQDGNEIVLDAALMCSSPKELKTDQQWTCEAMARVSVCSFDAKRQINEKTIPKTQFGNNCWSGKPIEVIRAADLSKYTQNGRVEFDVGVVLARPIFYQSSAEIDHQLAKFEFAVKNVSQIGTKRSPDLKVRGTLWDIFFKKDDGDMAIALGHKSYYLNVNWSWKVQCSFTLLSFDETIPPVTKTFFKDFQFDVPNWGFAKFMAWNELMDPAKRFVENDVAVIEIDLKVDAPKPLWDIEQLSPGKTKRSECSICLQDVVDRAPASMKCGHVFCNTCIRRSLEERQKCPNCNTYAKLEDIRPIFL